MANFKLRSIKVPSLVGQLKFRMKGTVNLAKFNILMNCNTYKGLAQVAIVVLSNG